LAPVIGIPGQFSENCFILGTLAFGNQFAYPSGEVAMELLMLIGFAGGVILLGFLSCVAGGPSGGSNARGERGEFRDIRGRGGR